jgi:hypothetical protein
MKKFGCVFVFILHAFTYNIKNTWILVGLKMHNSLETISRQFKKFIYN